MGDLTILDVGHGNAAVLRAAGQVVVIDCGANSLLLEHIKDEGITDVDHVLVSHSDKDHTHGLHHVVMEPSIRVGSIYMNPDQKRDDDSWLNLSAAIERARTIKGTILINGIDQDNPRTIALDGLEIEVLYPIPTDVMVSSKPNVNSAVIRISSQGSGEAMFTGDVGSAGLAKMTKMGLDLRARVLIFPHHGGLPGRANPFRFAARLCELVQPEVVVFSQARQSRHGNPLPAIVGGVRSVVPDAHIACTQLSKRCNGLPRHQLPHLSPRPAAGKLTHECCMGTLRLRLPRGGADPALEAHLETVAGFSTPMCLMQSDHLLRLNSGPLPS